jgi:hypothetical protein
MTLLAWLALILLVAWLLDRVLLWMEARAWINYRRFGLSRGAAAYHALELQSIFDPGIRHTQEVRYEERRSEEDSGADR